MSGWKLQWIHGSRTVLTRGNMDRRSHPDGASMGPRLKSRVNDAVAAQTPQGQRSASIDPRLKNRGSADNVAKSVLDSLVLQWIHGSRTVVAMSASATSRRWTFRFNGSTAQEPW